MKNSVEAYKKSPAEPGILQRIFFLSFLSLSRRLDKRNCNAGKDDAEGNNQ